MYSLQSFNSLKQYFVSEVVLLGIALFFIFSITEVPYARICLEVEALFALIHVVDSFILFERYAGAVSSESLAWPSSCPVAASSSSSGSSSSLKNCAGSAEKVASSASTFTKRLWAHYYAKDFFSASSSILVLK